MRSEIILPVVVVAQPGLMCESLVTFLGSIPGAQVLRVLDLDATALSAADAQAARVVIVDANANKGMITQLAILRVTRPRIRWIVLIDHVQQQRIFLSAGADSVLLKGFLDERLEQAVLAAARDAP